MKNGILPGGFLTAVLENDLRESFARADVMSVEQLPGLVAWMYWNLPSNVWGSREAVIAHIESFHAQNEDEVA